jgi:hypothetical protein
MPASNMGSPAALAGNPTTGLFVIMDPMSGPKGSPFDAKSYHPTTQLLVADPTNYSTGALSTGIGFSSLPAIGPTAPASITARGFTDDYVPGETFPDGVTPATDARMLYIGGGRSFPAINGIALDNMWSMVPIAGFGNGASRDGGAGPAFTGFGMKMVTATAATVANGAAIEVGFTNRSGVTMTIGQSAFGSSAAASAAPV